MAQEHTSQPRNEAATRNSPEVSPIETISPQASSSRENSTTPGGPSEQPRRDVEEEAPPPLPARPTRAATQQQPNPYQQPRMPYAPYPYQYSYQYTQPVRVLPKMSQRYIATKLGLTVLSSVLAIIIIALSAIFLSERGAAEGTAWYAMPIAVSAIIWNTAELITYCVRLRKESAQRGIHPGAHVALHLLFWLACIFAVLLSVSVYISVASILARCSDQSGDDDDDYYVGYSSGYRYRYCDLYTPLDYYYWNYLPVLRALIAMFVLAFINHFVLFVLACIDTHKRNLLKPAGVVLAPSPGQGMYYGAPPPQPGMVPMYYQYPVPQMANGGSAPAPGQPTSQSPEAKQALQNYQSLNGYYAPVAMPVPVPATAPAHAAVSPTLRQMGKAPVPAPAEATSSSNEKATPEQS
ncbi:hypothetical protein F5X99DRAFT_88136 [Biscogniauxia marginata]|nr:hypothetical protein F5X99DRAFT_88136 [Biscogniauxia marginata]